MKNLLSQHRASTFAISAPPRTALCRQADLSVLYEPAAGEFRQLEQLVGADPRLARDRNINQVNIFLQAVVQSAGDVSENVQELVESEIPDAIPDEPEGVGEDEGEAAPPEALASPTGN